MSDLRPARPRIVTASHRWPPTALSSPRALPLLVDLCFLVAVPAADRPVNHSMWTRRELLAWTTERFTQLGVDSPSADAQHLLAHALGCRRIDLLLDSDRVVQEPERAVFRELVRRRLAREPVAYIEGIRGFHALDLELTVDKRVLIPRPETEHLVDWLLESLSVDADVDTDDIDPREGDVETRVVLDEDEFGQVESSVGSNLGDASLEPIETYVVLDGELEPDLPEVETIGDESASRDGVRDEGNDDAPPGPVDQHATRRPHHLRPPDLAPALDVLDVGTGSGAIALALKRARPQWHVGACDVSVDALACARTNAERAGLDVAFVQSDLLESVAPPADGFAAIAANLPYIPSADLATLEPEVRDYEPHLALDGGPDGLDLVRRLVRSASTGKWLRPGGWLFLEIGIGQAGPTMALLREAGFVAVATRRDLAGIERVVAGRRPR